MDKLELLQFKFMPNLSTVPMLSMGFMLIVFRGI